MDQNTKDMLDALEFIKERMTTKDDLANFATKNDIADLKATMATKDHVKSISDELASIRRDLEELTEKVDNIVGLPKEIDHALERIAAIEKHLGLNKKIAA
jgi:uncharacterized membrane protein